MEGWWISSFSPTKESDDHFNKILGIANARNITDEAITLDEAIPLIKKVTPFLKWSMATAAVLIGLAVSIPYFNSIQVNSTL